jgi:hypothetical protein
MEPHRWFRIGMASAALAGFKSLRAARRQNLNGVLDSNV